MKKFYIYGHIFVIMSSKMVSECSVCCENFKYRNKCIQCDNCHFSACKKCVERYLLGCTQLAHCMNCRIEWNRKILIDKITNSFVKNEYKLFCEEYYYNKELALLPSSQPKAEKELQIQNLKKYISNAKLLKKNLKIAALVYSHKSNIDYGYQLYRITDNIDNANKELKNLKDGFSIGEEIQRIVYQRKCANPDCRGFVDDTWICNLCEQTTCRKCFELEQKDESHTCLPENIETANLLRKDSKPCPNCKTLIFKTEGCDQMFCTQCHTAFSWITGKIETDNIHNPHYYEYLRSQGKEIARNPLDIPIQFECNNDLSTLSRAIAHLNIDTDIGRKTIHIQEVIIPRYCSTNVNNEPLRIKYILGDININQFKVKIQSNYKIAEKKQQMKDILNTFVMGVTDILNNYIKTTNDVMEQKGDRYDSSIFIPFAEQINTLRKYVNNCLYDTAKIYKVTCYNITEEYEFRKV